MIYPGTSPAGFGFGQGRFGGGAQDLEQRKQALMKQMAASGGSSDGTLSFGGSTGDAAARLPGLGWNPFLAAQGAFGPQSGQGGNSDVSAQPFYGGGGGGNGQQSAAATVGNQVGSATQAGGVQNPGYNQQAPSGANRMDFGFSPNPITGATIQQLISYLTNPDFSQATPPTSTGNSGYGSPGVRYV